ncbi:SCO family protein [Longimicrobium sp.]|uniref:SCO family protein n=1 Tax=Longimicrobium sp. TaxID=2029185 RepID=UPI002CF7CA0C|nr:SCO family protein [Longimicrobium sp.]HSU13801.1 SCO family protein [Longimicrobium sp.]
MSTPLRRSALVLLAALAACGRGPAAAPRMAPASDFSVYDLESPWTDQAGRSRPLGSLAGRVQVVAMTYTHCAHTCPMIVGEFKRMEAGLTKEEAGRVGFVLFSLDPARDTPARLAEYARTARMQPARWTLLTSSDEQVRELAALLGIRYRPEGGGELSHSNAYLVLDARGHVIYRHDGLEGGVDEPLARIRASLASPPLAE